MKMNTGEEVCRTCLKVASNGDSFLSINLINFPQCVTIRSKLKSCIPEMDLPEMEQAYMCNPCIQLLDTAYVFRGMCLETEQKLNKLAPSYYADIIKTEKLDESFTMTNEINKPIDFVENEDVEMESMNQQVVQNGDLNHYENIKENIEIADVIETLVEIKSPLDENLIEIEVYNKNEFINESVSELTDDEIILNACQMIPELDGYEPSKLQCNVALEKLSENELLQKYESSKKLQLEDELQVVSRIEVNIEPNLRKTNNNNNKKKKRCFNSNRKRDDLRCSFCRHEFARRDKLLCHIRRAHTKEKPFACNYCEKRFYENWILKQHVRTHHAEDEINNKSISSTRNTRTQLNNKTTEEENLVVDDFKCKLCNQKCASLIGLQRHIKNMHNTIIKCEECNETFKSNLLYNNHIDRGCVKTFQCDVCSRKYPTLASKNKHAKEHETTVQGMYFCKDCRVNVQSKDHFNIHSGLRPYKCNLCTNDFSSSLMLASHIRSHSKDNPFKCNQCNKTFDKRTLFDSHMLIHKQKYKCNTCKKCFNYNVDLNSHTCVDSTGEKVYRCEVCKNNFTGRAALIEHVKVHF